MNYANPNIMDSRLPFSDIISKLILLFSSIILLLLQPLFAQEVSWNNVNHNTNNGKHTITLSNNDQSLNIEHEGNILIGDDDKTVVGITDGGFLRIKKKTFGNARELYIESNGATLNYEYKEGGRQVAYEPTGKAWLGDILPEIVRSTRIGAESRVNRLYKKGGSQAVLSEVGRMESDYTQAGYISLLMAKNPPKNELGGIISTVGSRIDSDFYRYEIFKENKNTLLSDPQNMGLYLTAVKSVESDFYKAGLVKLAFDKGLPENYTTQALELIGTIDSDFHKKEVLDELLDKRLSDQQIDLVLSKLLGSIDSDFHRTEIIKRVISKQDKLSQQNIDSIIESIKNTDSDFHKAESLKYLLSKHQLSAANYATLFSSLGGIESDFHLAGIMKELMKAPNLNDFLDPMLQAVSRMHSDFHQAEILNALIDNAKLSDAQLVSIAQTGSTLKSDFHKAHVLKSICQKSKNEKVKQAVAEAAKSVRSSFHLGEIHACLNR